MVLHFFFAIWLFLSKMNMELALFSYVEFVFFVFCILEILSFFFLYFAFSRFGVCIFLYFVFLRFWIRIFWILFLFFGQKYKTIQNKFPKNVFLYFLCFSHSFSDCSLSFTFRQKPTPQVHQCTLYFHFVDHFSSLMVVFFCNLGLYFVCILEFLMFTDVYSL